jgi:DNA-binding transcriptional regulator YhcF (GntR family)
MQLHPGANGSWYHHVADVLRGEIRAGIFPPGTALPSEGQLAARYGTSRVVVRRALAVLRAELLVLTRRGRQSLVRADPARRTIILNPGDRLRCEIPSHPDRITLGLDEGVALLKIQRARGDVDCYPHDEVEIITLPAHDATAEAGAETGVEAVAAPGMVARINATSKARS